MEDQPIKLAFTYSYQELREGFLRKASTGRIIYGIFGVLSWIFILLALLGWLLMSHAISLGSTVSYPPEIDDLWLTLFPSLLPAGFVFFALIGQLISGASFVGLDGGTDQSKKSKVVSQTTGIIGGLLIGYSFHILFHPEMAIPWAPTRAKIVVVSFLPWILLAFCLIAYGTLNRNSKLRRMWGTVPSWSREKFVELDENGITVTDSLYSARYRWAYCKSYSETANLFKITLEDLRIILLPKRAIPPHEMLRLQVMIHDHIRTGKFLSTGGKFEVIAPRPVLQIPDLPAQQ